MSIETLGIPEGNSYSKFVYIGLNEIYKLNILKSLSEHYDEIISLRKKHNVFTDFDHTIDISEAQLKLCSEAQNYKTTYLDLYQKQITLKLSEIEEYLNIYKTTVIENKNISVTENDVINLSNIFNKSFPFSKVLRKNPLTLFSKYYKSTSKKWNPTKELLFLSNISIIINDIKKSNLIRTIKTVKLNNEEKLFNNQIMMISNKLFNNKNLLNKFFDLYNIRDNIYKILLIHEFNKMKYINLTSLIDVEFYESNYDEFLYFKQYTKCNIIVSSIKIKDSNVNEFINKNLKYWKNYDKL